MHSPYRQQEYSPNRAKQCSFQTTTSLHFINISRNGVHDFDSPQKQFVSTNQDLRLSTSQRKQQQHCQRLYLKGKQKVMQGRMQQSQSLASLADNRKVSKTQVEQSW